MPSEVSRDLVRAAADLAERLRCDRPWALCRWRARCDDARRDRQIQSDGPCTDQSYRPARVPRPRPERCEMSASMRLAGVAEQFQERVAVVDDSAD
jgi:hypothetical protein